MKETDLYNIFLDYLTGNKDVGKEILVEEIGKNEDLRQTIQALARMSRKPASPDRDRMWNTIRKELRLRQRRRRFRRWGAVAAVFIPIVIGGTLFLNRSENRQTEPLELVQNDHRIRLFLADGHVVQIQKEVKDSVIEIGGMSIQVGRTQMVAQAGADQTESAKEGHHMLQVPRGCEYQLTLPDGSRVWLNSDTELKFPVRFSANERRVFLKGEAYFEVAKDNTKPFRVESYEMTVEALGTSFNINSYRDGGSLIATLMEGSVKIMSSRLGKEIYLEPGEQVRLHKEVIEVVPVDMGPVIAWKEGRFEFANMTLMEIARQLERWYDVEISFADPILQNYSFTGVIKRYNLLCEITSLIEETTKVKFQIDGHRIIVDKLQ